MKSSGRSQDDPSLPLDLDLIRVTATMLRLES